MLDFQCIHQIPKEIGLISDTHDQRDRIVQAIEIFKKHNIQTILHAGDVIQSNILELFTGFDLYLAFGNGDNPIDLTKACKEYHFNEPKEYHCLSHKKIHLFLFHGHAKQVPIFREICLNQKYSFIVKGHTHFQEDYCRNNIQIINPGALNHPEQNTVAILDLEKKETRFFKLN